MRGRKENRRKQIGVEEAEETGPGEKKDCTSRIELAEEFVT